MSDRSRLLSLWSPVVAYMVFIFGLSSIAHPPDLPDVPGLGADKIIHGLLYAGLSALVVRALAGGWRRHVGAMIAVGAILVSIAYGVSDEFHQSFVPPRQVDALDVVADGVGAALAAGLLYAGIIRPRHDL